MTAKVFRKFLSNFSKRILTWHLIGTFPTNFLFLMASFRKAKLLLKEGQASRKLLFMHNWYLIKKTLCFPRRPKEKSLNNKQRISNNFFIIALTTLIHSENIMKAVFFSMSKQFYRRYEYWRLSDYDKLMTFDKEWRKITFPSLFLLSSWK